MPLGLELRDRRCLLSTARAWPDSQGCVDWKAPGEGGLPGLLALLRCRLACAQRFGAQSTQARR